jgi:transmembrane sensor
MKHPLRMIIWVMDNHQIQHLIEKYKSGTASETELEALKTWYAVTGYTDASYPEEEERTKQRILMRLQQQIAPGKGKKLWILRSRISGAAAAVILLLLAGYFYRASYFSNTVTGTDIAPGSNRATLTLASGKVISLSDALQGKLDESSDVSVTKTKDGQIVYTSGSAVNKHNNITKDVALNTVATPRGGQYQVIMPDGSRVWLNAASSIRFPVTFGQQRKRIVELNGEAYFEVAKDREHPFVVSSKGQQVEVLGTHFNVSSYAEEGLTKTTLLEGSVKISVSSGRTEVLRPGQQSVLKGSGLDVFTVSTEQAVAWKDALFVFDHDNLENIMYKISRWYDVEVVYNNEGVKNELFSGKVSRFENVSEVLKKLALTDAVKFKIEGRRILVMK